MAIPQTLILNPYYFMKKSYYLAAAALGVATTTGLVAGFSFAHPLGLGQAAREEIQAVHTAIGENDYDAWASAMQERVTMMRTHADELEASINPDTFAKIVEAQQLLLAGDREGAKAIFDELGIHGFGFGKPMFMHRIGPLGPPDSQQ
jgi:hypothetical protein